MLNSLRLILVTLLLLLSSGCSTTRAWDSTASKWLIPVNVTAAYFGSVALHEAGHAFPAMALGADDVNVYVLPKTDREGNRHLGLTTYKAPYGKLSDTDHTIISAMGPTAQYVGHLGTRALLRSRRMPRLIQPTLAWFGLFNQIGYYFHAANGLFRNKATDLGKHDAWISAVMLAGAATIDIIDMLSDDKPENKLLVLFGEYFYEPRPKEHARLRLISAPQRGGAFLGVRLEW